MTADSVVTGRAAHAALAEGVHWSLFRITAAIRRHEYLGSEVSLTQCSILYRLHDHGPMRLTDLAALDGVTKATMAVAINRLEAIGMVRRRRDDVDGRILWIEPTDKGLDARRHSVAQFLDAMCSVLTAAEMTALVEAAPALHTLARLYDLDSRTLFGDDVGPVADGTA